MAFPIDRISAEDRRLLKRAAAWPGLRALDEITPGAMRRLAEDAGIDFATAVIYDRLCRSAEHEATIEQLRAIDHQVTDSSPAYRGTVAIVPGAFHRQRRRRTGADGRVVREEAERLGFAVAVAPTRSFGSLEENSAIVRGWLSRCADAPIVVVSLSKGTAELKMALRDGDPAEMFRRVAAWVSLSGMWWGSPLVSWLRARPLRSWIVRQLLRMRGEDFRVLEQLDYGPDQPLAFDVEIPPSVQLLHVVGFPLRRDLCSRLARRGHRRLSPLGPNDAAGLLLADACRLPGEVYPVWGADHYLRPRHEDNRLLVRRILLWLCQYRGLDSLLEARVEA